MARLLLLKGVSGSGKSIKAKELTLNSNYFRVNRDDLREQLYAGKWSGQKEKVVIAVEKAMVKAILESGQSVVVDDTNLTNHHEVMWKDVVVQAKAFGKNDNISFEKLEIKTPLDVCIARDKLRPKPITQAVIERQALKSGLYPLNQEDNSIVLCDLDGTIFDGSHRQPILDDKRDKLRWVKYFSLCDKDKPIEIVIKWLHALKADGKQIVLVSGRAADLTLDKTVASLKEHNVPYDRLLMRLGGDSRPDTETKQEILNEILLTTPKSAIAFVIDDRPAVLRKWQELGIPIKPVYQGEFLTEVFTEHKPDCKNLSNPIKGRCSICGALEDF